MAESPWYEWALLGLVALALALAFWIAFLVEPTFAQWVLRIIDRFDDRKRK